MKTRTMKKTGPKSKDAAAPRCPKCRKRMLRWAGDEWICPDCAAIAPLRLELPFSLPIMSPSARWPGNRRDCVRSA